jgi:hypothetical protein
MMHVHAEGRRSHHEAHHAKGDHPGQHRDTEGRLGHQLGH